MLCWLVESGVRNVICCWSHFHNNWWGHKVVPWDKQHLQRHRANQVGPDIFLYELLQFIETKYLIAKQKPLLMLVAMMSECRAAWQAGCQYWHSLSPHTGRISQLCNVRPRVQSPISSHPWWRCVGIFGVVSIRYLHAAAQWPNSDPTVTQQWPNNDPTVTRAKTNWPINAVLAVNIAAVSCILPSTPSP